eukprot:3938106-Rhodomonas_salina.7
MQCPVLSQRVWYDALPMQCPVLSERMLPQREARQSPDNFDQVQPIALCACYALSGTDIAYADTLCLCGVRY